MNCDDINRIAQAAAQAEREACAKVCEKLAQNWVKAGFWGSIRDFSACAQAIRQRENDSNPENIR